MKQVDPGKLTSVDENGDRLKIIPAEVKGYFKTRRQTVQLVLLFVFLALPWTHINGLQTILINIPEREFAFFGILFRAHDVPLLFLLVASFLLALGFMTAVWGRVWCGWACPQTVFIEVVYRRLEIWIEGNYLERRKLSQGPMTPEKARKVFLKWTAFTIVSFIIAHSFLAYLVGANNLIKMMGHSPSENFGYFALVMGMTTLLLFDFAWFREQFCVIMCPYGRIQSLFLDRNSLAITYHTQRGEPRRGQAPREKQGDCVDCGRCVSACPVGIDIRNGLQLECIACTACIDACDEIMEKVEKPKGLISYATIGGGKPKWTVRTFAYIIGFVICTGALAWNVSSRKSFYFSALRQQGAPYTIINESSQSIALNQFKLHIQNQSLNGSQFKMSVLSELPVTIAENPIYLQSKQSRDWFFFVRAPVEVFKESHQIKVKVEVQDLKTLDKDIKEITVIGPRL